MKSETDFSSSNQLYCAAQSAHNQLGFLAQHKNDPLKRIFSFSVFIFLRVIDSLTS